MDIVQLIVSVVAVLNLPLLLTINFKLGRISATVEHQEKRLGLLEARI